MKNTAIQNLDHDLSLMQENTANLLARIERDLMLIQNLYIDKQVHAVISKDSYSISKNNIKELDNELLSFTKTREIYYQLRILDNEGNEIGRVQCDSSDSDNQAFSIIPQNKLSRTPQIFYTLMAKDLVKNQIALAPAELINQNNEPVPVISFLMPVFLKIKKPVS